MHRRRLVAVTCLLAAVGTLAAVRSVRASTICESALPGNIAAPLIQHEMLALLQQSGTFRQQCRRIAAVPSVHVTFVIVRTIQSDHRAETIMRRFEEGALFAEVKLEFGEDYLELIAHELEHVIEQIDGVRLRDEVLAQRAWIARGGGFETRRAIQAGNRVRQECSTLTVETAHVDRRTPVQRHPFP